MSIQVFPPESVEAARQTRIYIDRYSGEVLYLKDARKASLGDRIFNWFQPLHYGTFGGLLTRILYVFVGLAPVVLLSTGFVMWKHRQRVKTRSIDVKI